jgi:hypothetical protein
MASPDSRTPRYTQENTRALMQRRCCAAYALGSHQMGFYAISKRLFSRFCLKRLMDIALEILNNLLR